MFQIRISIWVACDWTEILFLRKADGLFLRHHLVTSCNLQAVSHIQGRFFWISQVCLFFFHGNQFKFLIKLEIWITIAKQVNNSKYFRIYANLTLYNDSAMHSLYWIHCIHKLNLMATKPLSTHNFQMVSGDFPEENVRSVAWTSDD